jgi:hypothetical protein
MLIVITCPEKMLVVVSKATEVVGDNLSPLESAAEFVQIAPPALHSIVSFWLN